MTQSAHRHIGTPAHRFGVNLPGIVLVFVLVSFGTYSCGDGMLNEYLNADSAIWTNAPVLVDTNHYAEITVQENGNGPELTVLYGCADSCINRLIKLDADLIVNGTILEPSQSNLSASYASTYIDLPMTNPYDSISKKLGIDSSYYMESFPVGLNLSKNYSSIKELPKQLSVHFTSETAGGNTDTTIVLILRSTKDTRAPIRFH